MYLNILLYTITVTYYCIQYLISIVIIQPASSTLSKIYWMNINKRVKFKYDLILQKLLSIPTVGEM